MSVFAGSLFFALFCFCAGCLWRISRWFTVSIGPEGTNYRPFQRVYHALYAVIQSLFTHRLVSLSVALIRDVLLQWHIFRQNPWRWLMHMLIAWPITLLVIFHAADDIVTRLLFPDYVSTLNPFFMLRSLLGFLAVMGLLIATGRRFFIKSVRRDTKFHDIAVLLLLLAMAGTGLLADSIQIVSEPIFNNMVDDYLGDDDPEVIGPLKVYWGRTFHVVFEDPPENTGADVWETGRDIHMESCVDCHSLPQTAAASLVLAQLVKPIAVSLNRVRADVWIWYVHFGLAFTGLALVPFCKLFHMVATPMALLQKQIAPLPSHPANRLTARALALDACTRCGVCSRHCSVSPIFEVIPNTAILPAEKIGNLREIAVKEPPGRALEIFSHGNFICTECHHCTLLCPSGINLQDLWITAKEISSTNREGEFHQKMISRPAADWLPLPDKSDEPFEMTLPIPSPEAFETCIQCSICAGVCPVVELSRDAGTDPEATPQQVMNLLRLEQSDLALVSRMTWNCVTCYQCQEACPQQIRVADILYSLRNRAWQRLDPAIGRFKHKGGK